MSKLRDTLSQAWLNIQSSLFPWLSEELGPLAEKQLELVTTLEVVRIEEFIYSNRGVPGRPTQDRTAIAKAFVVEMIYNLPTTLALLERLVADSALRRIYGWERKNDVPDEWTFSRAFAEFSKSRLPERVHEAFIKTSYEHDLVGHNSRDSTAIEAREKPLKKKPIQKIAAKRGRHNQGEERIKPLTRIERQASGMGLEDMLNDLPTACDVGTKKNSKGYKVSWIGYKLHIEMVDGGIPLCAVLTSASTHDSQVVAVEMAVTSRPPHRSVRAELPHTAPAKSSGLKSLFWVRMQHFKWRQKTISKFTKTTPWHSVTLAPAQ